MAINVDRDRERDRERERERERERSINVDVSEECCSRVLLKTTCVLLCCVQLLPDLEYSERLTVLTVHNGRQSTFNGSWSISDFTRCRRNLSQAM